MLGMEKKDIIIGGVAVAGLGFGIADFVMAKKALKKAKLQAEHNEKVDQAITILTAQMAMMNAPQVNAATANNVVEAAAQAVQQNQVQPAVVQEKK